MSNTSTGMWEPSLLSTHGPLNQLKRYQLIPNNQKIHARFKGMTGGAIWDEDDWGLPTANKTPFIHPNHPTVSGHPIPSEQGGDGEDWAGMMILMMMDESMNEWMKEWRNEGMNEWMKEWLNEWMNERMNEWTNERKNERTNEWMNGWMSE